MQATELETTCEDGKDDMKSVSDFFPLSSRLTLETSFRGENRTGIFRQARTAKCPGIVFPSPADGTVSSHNPAPATTRLYTRPILCPFFTFLSAKKNIMQSTFLLELAPVLSVRSLSPHAASVIVDSEKQRQPIS